MAIKIEYIVLNKGKEVKRFDSKTDAEAYDSIITFSEELELMIQPAQKKLKLTDDQVCGIAEHLAFQSDEIKIAMKHIKKPKVPVKKEESKEEMSSESQNTVASKKKAVSKK